MKKNLLITGGSGYLGVNLALKLKKNTMYFWGHEIRKEIEKLQILLIAKIYH